MGQHRSIADMVYHIRKKEQNAVLAAAEVGAVKRNAAAEKPKKDACYIDDTLRKRWSENETTAISELVAGIEFTNTKHLEDSESQIIIFFCNAYTKAKKFASPFFSFHVL